MVRSGDVPSRGDALLLGAYRFLVAGLSLSVDEDPDRAGLIDAGIVTTALTALAWIFLVEPAIQADDVAVAVRAVAVAFPLAGIVVVVLALRLAFTGALHSMSFRLLAAGLTAMLVGDGLHAFTAAAGRAPEVAGFGWNRSPGSSSTAGRSRHGARAGHRRGPPRAPR